MKLAGQSSAPVPCHCFPLLCFSSLLPHRPAYGVRLCHCPGNRSLSGPQVPACFLILSYAASCVPLFLHKAQSDPISGRLPWLSQLIQCFPSVLLIKCRYSPFPSPNYLNIVCKYLLSTHYCLCLQNINSVSQWFYLVS